jgi:hypothetical protein
MTSVRGYRIIASLCCGARFSTPRYGSINFTAYEYWTDGQRVNSLAPTDGGLRRCTCGALFLLRDVIEIGFEETQETAPATYVADVELASLLSLPMTEDVELVLRRRYWRFLNDPYRDLYRAHRKSVDDADKEAKKGATTLWRSLGRKLLGAKPPPPAAVDTTARPFTVPPFNATEPQRGNMQVLLSMLLGSSQKADPLEIAELYRELENYDEAQKAIEQFEAEDHVASKLLRELIKEKAKEPMRYRI